MSDTDTTTETEGTQDDSGAQENANIRQLREKANRVDALEAEIATFKQNTALSEAGLKDLTEIQRKALLATHSGESTPEAFRAHAESLGFVASESQQNEHKTNVTQEEQSAHRQFANAATGGTAAGQESPEQLIASAGNAKELEALLRSQGAKFASDFE